MTIKEQLIQELDQLPESILGQILNFVLFLKKRLLDIAGRSPVVSDAPTEEPNVLLKLAEMASRDMPEEAWKDLPSDFSINLDHYLYGAPKVEK
ncbi:MAG: hypothetical protein Fur0042_20390 [Cyanophyceae cyanobacterium]